MARDCSNGGGMVEVMEYVITVEDLGIWLGNVLVEIAAVAVPAGLVSPVGSQVTWRGIVCAAEVATAVEAAEEAVSTAVNLDTLEEAIYFVRVVPACSEELKPVVGQKFQSLDFALAFYDVYARAVASNAKDDLNFTHVNGKPIRIMFSHRDPSLRKSGYANLFIKNLDQAIDTKALFKTFSAFGTVLSCKIAVDHNENSRGYGFVQFDKEEAAQNVLRLANEAVFPRGLALPARSKIWGRDGPVTKAKVALRDF
ncbi:polyadenylate-binding protein 1-like 2 [Salvia splendens]|uniref:polyadenylate-binding protein 1-like 2 n=1 Tax=Salvia splendens TaxID=180675 RepID=UPI001C2623A1|nr:polyadenylate-binding protein 1-like 2 [Salvia splendens]